MNPEFETLRRILQLETTRGYDDRAVIGGLSSFLRRWSFVMHGPDSEALMTLRELKVQGDRYSTWGLERRKGWAQALDKCLAGLANGGTTRTLPKPEGAGGNEGKAVRSGPAHPALPGHVVPNRLRMPVGALQGVGPSMAARLEKLGAGTVHDLLYLFPRRHIDYSRTTLIGDLVEGKEQTIIASVWHAGLTHFGRLKGSEVVLGDETGNIRAIWINQPWVAQRFPTNARVVISGRVNIHRGERLFESPEWDLLVEKDLVHAGRLVPVYPLTKGLYSRQMRNLMKRVVDNWAGQETDFLPEDLRQRRGLLPLAEALRQAHFPDDQESMDRARQRLAFDELLVLQLGVVERKKEWQQDELGSAIQVKSATVEDFLRGLPFRLTQAQDDALSQVLADLASTRPMSRLLQGDVGSGKTVVAAAAMIAAVDSGFQAALMAPTQILAEQHFKTIARLLPAKGLLEGKDISFHSGLLDRPISVALLTGTTAEKKKGHIYNMIKEGAVDIAIGTHALVQKGLDFARLGLIIVDEQHRFGVMQRAALRQKGFNPHLLVMTATPIPRTLALTLFGDLDITTIGEMPPGRQRVKTRWLAPQHRQKAYDFVRRQVSEAHQAFVICPLVEESEAIEARAAVTEFERLSQEVFPDLKLGLLHGRMAGNEKEDVMRRFTAREFDILVSTSVVEVGIDVPNATVMLVEGADRFGLSQMHQFRGRVGRGEAQSYCILLADDPSPEARERLSLIERTWDGFLLAEEDMKLRGPGEFFGTRQSGMPDLRMAKMSDTKLLEGAREEALKLFEADPGLKSTVNAALRKQMARAWKQETEVS
ncbi:MAG: ATP-dependent DNA helicase RecG [Chloroflexi bacterium]|nr:ATP-dependent DNA helicase RecG [Chloroflexota bacterium]